MGKVASCSENGAIYLPDLVKNERRPTVYPLAQGLWYSRRRCKHGTSPHLLGLPRESSETQDVSLGLYAILASFRGKNTQQTRNRRELPQPD